MRVSVRPHVVQISKSDRRKGGDMGTAASRWDPFRDLLSIQSEMNRLFGSTYGNVVDSTEATGSWSPSLDIYQGEDGLTAIVELPGMTHGDVDISVEDNVLTIKGERKFYDEVSEEKFHRIERRYGQYLRRISLPQHSDTGAIEAAMKDGLLTIRVPKSEQALPKRIEVMASEG